MQQAEVAQKGFAILATSIILRKASSAIRYREAARDCGTLSDIPLCSQSRAKRDSELSRRKFSAAIHFHSGAHCDKSPISNWLVAWHQDKALPLRERRELAGRGPWSVKDGVIYANAPAPRGGILIMSPLIVHASSKSRSAMTRRVVHVAYAASATIAEGLELATA
jgi:hypothetical protein